MFRIVADGRNTGASPVVLAADAGSLQINVSGLPVVHGPNLAAGAILVSNKQAGTVQETGTRTISAPNVELLGQDVADTLAAAHEQPEALHPLAADLLDTADQADVRDGDRDRLA